MSVELEEAIEWARAKMSDLREMNVSSAELASKHIKVLVDAVSGSSGEPLPLPTCETCRFWGRFMADVVGKPADKGRCQVEAPKIDMRDQGAVWPTTEDVDWCGRFEPKGGRK